ncbi:hypothetical protein Hanom_Chr14g01320171 [Helianthus anomalus]
MLIPSYNNVKETHQSIPDQMIEAFKIVILFNKNSILKLIQYKGFFTLFSKTII